MIRPLSFRPAARFQNDSKRSPRAAAAESQAPSAAPTGGPSSGDSSGIAAAPAAAPNTNCATSPAHVLPGLSEDASRGPPMSFPPTKAPASPTITVASRKSRTRPPPSPEFRLSNAAAGTPIHRAASTIAPSQPSARGVAGSVKAKTARMVIAAIGTALGPLEIPKPATSSINTTVTTRPEVGIASPSDSPDPFPGAPIAPAIRTASRQA